MMHYTITRTRGCTLTPALVLGGLAILASGAAAQSLQPVHWTASAKANATGPGGKTSVALTATIDSGWHIYSLTQGSGGPVPTRIAVAPGQPFVLDGTIAVSKPAVTHDPTFGIDVETYEHIATFTVPVAVSATAKTGAQHIRLSARYEVCNAAMCLPPKTVRFTVPVIVRTRSSDTGDRDVQAAGPVTAFVHVAVIPMDRERVLTDQTVVVRGTGITALGPASQISGLTPYQALVTGTRNVALYFGTLAKSGTVSVGKRADVVLLDGNPLADIQNAGQITGVMLGGRWFSRADLDARMAAAVPPGPKR